MIVDACDDIFLDDVSEYFIMGISLMVSRSYWFTVTEVIFILIIIST